MTRTTINNLDGMMNILKIVHESVKRNNIYDYIVTHGINKMTNVENNDIKLVTAGALGVKSGISLEITECSFVHNYSPGVAGALSAQVPIKCLFDVN